MIESFIGYIYKITIPTSEGLRYYWGRKQATKIDINYFGSGVKLKKWIASKTNGKITAPYSMSVKIAEELGLKREIIAYAKTLEELYKLEEEAIAPHLGKEYCWNLIEGGLNSTTYGRLDHPCSEETKAKIRAKNKGRKLSDEVCKHISEGHLGIPSPKGMLGKHLSKEAIEKRKQTMIKKGTWRKPLSLETIAKIKAAKQNISEETRRRMSEGAKKRKRTKHTEEYKLALSKKRMGKNNPAYGRKWWNNGKINIYQKEQPAGFAPGMLRKKKSKL